MSTVFPTAPSETGAAVAAASAASARLPWTATAAALIAMAALYHTSGMGAGQLAGFGAAILATYLTSARLPDRSLLLWLVRIMLFGLVVMLNQGEVKTGDYSVGPPQFRNMFGELWAAEMVVRAWRHTGDAPSRTLPVLLLSGLVFISACNTFDFRHIRFIAPVYMLFVALSLRGYRPRQETPSAAVARPGIRRGALYLRGFLTLLALGLGAGSYLAFWEYRGELTSWGSRWLERQSFREGTGMSSQPSLGPTFGLRGSSERVLRVATGEAQNVDTSHLRGMSFDTYAGGRWYPAIGNRAFTPAAGIELLGRGGGGAATPSGEIRVTRLSSGNRLLFLPLQTTEVIPDETEEAVQWALPQGGPLRVKAVSPFGYSLTVPADESFPGLFAAPPTPEQRAALQAVPEDLDPKVRALARRITDGITDPADRAEAIVLYLIANHRYSDTTNPGSGDPVSNFLLQKKDAHCEFFAASAALLLRCVDVPTRYVTGYYAHENEEPGMTIVRQRDAHAWAEAWIEGKGWIVVEATPGNGRPDHNPAPIPAWQQAWENFQDALQKVRDWIATFTLERLALIVGGIAFLGLLFPVYQAVRGRRGLDRTAPFAYASADARLSALGTRFEARLALSGVTVPAERTWQEHLMSLANPVSSPEQTAQPAPGAAFLGLARTFVYFYEQARFGGHDGNEETLARLHDLLHRMEQEQPSPSPQQPMSSKTA